MDYQTDVLRGFASFLTALLGANLMTIELLAKRGLVDPAEIDLIADQIISHFPPPVPGDAADRLRASFERVSGEMLARIRVLAAATWKG